jgi:hypothetical protein
MAYTQPEYCELMKRTAMVKMIKASNEIYQIVGTGQCFQVAHQVDQQLRWCDMAKRRDERRHAQ